MRTSRVFFAACFTCATTVHADLIHVPADHPTIQAAVDAASDGDEVVVAEGTYFENIDFNGKAIILRSTDPANPIVVAGTIIDGSGGGSAVTCNSGEGPDTVLSGFVITAGNSYYGGGMFNQNSSPTVERCTFIGHSAVYGGGMFNQNGSATVKHCTFTGNSASYGGGMYNINFSSPMVIDCTFGDNTASIDGGGMYSFNFSSPTVSDSQFISNMASNNGGGMINRSESNSTIIRCTFSWNTAGDSGGAMYNFMNISARVIDCTFNENTAGDDGGGMVNVVVSHPLVTNCLFSGNTAVDRGGGMYNPLNGSPVVTNCTFSDNAAEQGGGMFNTGAGTYGYSIPVLTNCIMWADSPDEIAGPGAPIVTYSDIQGSWPGAGNIDLDPQFVGVEGSKKDEPTRADSIYRLSPDSPCIDAGVNVGVPFDLADLDADGDTTEFVPLDLIDSPRFADEPDVLDVGCGMPAVVDLGAYEFPGQATQPVLGDLNGDLAVNAADLALLLAGWGVPAGSCLAELNLDGAVDSADLAILLSNWTPSSSTPPP